MQAWMNVLVYVGCLCKSSNCDWCYNIIYASELVTTWLLVTIFNSTILTKRQEKLWHVKIDYIKNGADSYLWLEERLDLPLILFDAGAESLSAPHFMAVPLVDLCILGDISMRNKLLQKYTYPESFNSGSTVLSCCFPFPFESRFMSWNNFIICNSHSIIHDIQEPLMHIFSLCQDLDPIRYALGSIRWVLACLTKHKTLKGQPKGKHQCRIHLINIGGDGLNVSDG